MTDCRSHHNYYWQSPASTFNEQFSSFRGSKRCQLRAPSAELGNSATCRTSSLAQLRSRAARETYFQHSPGQSYVMMFPLRLSLWRTSASAPGSSRWAKPWSSAMGPGWAQLRSSAVGSGMVVNLGPAVLVLVATLEIRMFWVTWMTHVWCVHLHIQYMGFLFSFVIGPEAIFELEQYLTNKNRCIQEGSLLAL